MPVTEPEKDRMAMAAINAPVQRLCGESGLQDLEVHHRLRRVFRRAVKSDSGERPGEVRNAGKKVKNVVNKGTREA